MCCNDFMNIRIERREAAIDHMADYVLSAGLAGATLRPLVKGGRVLDALVRSNATALRASTSGISLSISAPSSVRLIRSTVDSTITTSP
jgi:hypothetical protein